ncbi:hypothetical protein NUU61_008593 [Penicillium alfredii]|uniref:Uncharacterized protein n=1 Tax=Penicillium alfredii TaxID=1506179 RepID=A0A9W9JW41_9EURO|nr:uncharacterized protein NUU61_008593 [Penicillium alfredii]KAJ5084014.1 hypothetical protein NUU61_008593 [Penicillium alfredii]
MATTHGTVTHLPAGPIAASASTAEDEMHEYERILRISDEIFAGSHPRLKVPQQFVRKSGARNGKNAPSSQAPAIGKSVEFVSEKAPMLETATQPPKSSQAVPSGYTLSAAPANATPSPTHTMTKPASEIDPIFLTKSDDLVRAELQLQRQRIERSLRDQLEQKKQDSKHKPAIQDTKPDFNVSEVLGKALEMVKPVSLSDPSEGNGPGAPSDSFDDNSFYSSRAPDSPPQMGDHRKPSPVTTAKPAGPAKRFPVDQFTDELQRLEALNQPGSDQEMQDAYPVDQRYPYSQKPPRHDQVEVADGRFRESQQVDTLEEPEYSPPAPAVPPPMDERHYHRVAEDGNGRRPEPGGGYIDQTGYMRRPPSPAGNVRVVQNHITSPAAPQPSRVSPLATAKAPSMQPLRDERTEHLPYQVYTDPESGRGTPAGPPPNVTSRKRRRLYDKGEEARQVSYRRQDVDFADSYIKEEPVSPPPFSDDPAVIQSRHRQERPVYVDISSSRYTPVMERHELPAREPVYEVDPYHEMPLDPGPPRTISRLSTRRPARDDADLRRVASVQYARHAEYPREYIETGPRVARAPSYAIVEPHERSRYYQETPFSYTHRYVAVDDLGRPIYREPYYEEAPPPRIMAPQRRVVVDEHGNQYYELPPAPRLQPMAPPPRPVSRLSKAEAYEDRPALRTASVRAPSVVQDPYSERRYVQDMPPPQPVYRRVVSDYARPPPSDRRTYAAPPDGSEPYSRSSSVQVADYPPRRAPYVEEHPVPQERVVRTASIRPPTRYNEPHDLVQRVGSVRPAGPNRELSVFLEDRLTGDYIERPYYVRERHYYDGEDGGQMGLDGAGDSVQRVPHRY